MDIGVVGHDINLVLPDAIWFNTKCFSYYNFL